MSYWSDFISLIFPQVCHSCGNNLLGSEKTICTTCLVALPQTNFHLERDNPIEKIFWGRVPIEAATAYYSYAKAGHVQNLVHKLKYKNVQEIGVFLGKIIGEELKQVAIFNTIDVIIPVPLHPTKQANRGYNQSSLIATGIAESMGKASDFELIKRNKHTDTQTKKTRYKRWENVDSMFTILDFKKYESKHILLVDDVITTGATIEACVQELLKIENAKVSIVALAWAHKV
jgi:competence protein ComFC